MSAVTNLVHRVRHLLWVVRVLVGAGMLAPMRPDKYVRFGLVVRRQGTTPMTGISLSAVRRPQGSRWSTSAAH